MTVFVNLTSIRCHSDVGSTSFRLSFFYRPESLSMLVSRLWCLLVNGCFPVQLCLRLIKVSLLWLLSFINTIVVIRAVIVMFISIINLVYILIYLVVFCCFFEQVLCIMVACMVLARQSWSSPLFSRLCHYLSIVSWNLNKISVTVLWLRKYLLSINLAYIPTVCKFFLYREKETHFQMYSEHLESSSNSNTVLVQSQSAKDC